MEENQPLHCFYIYDALCGWCYGFSKTFHRFYDRYESNIQFHVLSGGMVRGEKEGPIGEVAGYIQDAYKEVEQRTGVKFGEKFIDGTLKEGSAHFTSIRTSVAMTVMKLSSPEKQVPYALSLQKAIYQDGVEPTDDMAFAKIASKFGQDTTQFLALMKQDRVLKRTEQEFDAVNKMGVKGFPTVIIQMGDKAVPIAKGYTELADLEKNFNAGVHMLQQAD